MKLANIIGNQKQQAEGKWVKEPDTGAEFKIAYSESKTARDFIQKRTARARQKSRKAFIRAEVLAQITLDLLVQHVLLDWKGIEDNDGKEFPFNPANARYLLENSAMIRDFVASEAGDPENFGVAMDDKDTDETGEAGKAANKSEASAGAAV